MQKGDRSTGKAKALGINHVVLEVGDLDQALDFYGAIFDFTLRGRNETQAFIDMGDQFLQLSLTDEPHGKDTKRHFGFVVDDRSTIPEMLEKLGAERLKRMNFLDPWGNRIEVVPYENIQFTKADHILRAMDAGDVKKTPEAIKELKEKGMSPDDAG